MVKNKIAPVVLAAALLGSQTAFANTAFEYTPVMPRVVGPRMNIENNGLEKYDSHAEREYPKVEREDKYTGGNAERTYLFDENGIVHHERSIIVRSLNAESNTDSVAPNQTDDIIEAVPIEEIENSSNISGGLVVKTDLVDTIDEVNNIKVNGELPQIVNINNAVFAKNLNEKIQQSYLSLVNAGYRSISTNYEVHNWANITSIVVKYDISEAKNSANGKEIVKTFVFDSISQSEITLRNLLGKDYMQYINRNISEQIKKSDVGLYYSGANSFSSIRSNQSFYVKDGKIIIVFDEYSIAPGSSGTPEFEIAMDGISFNLTKNEYIKKDDVIYIPATAAIRLGMKVQLKAGGIMEITSYDGKTVKEINVNNESLNPLDVTYI
ncbi:RsiV family protein, partial [Tyzzerella sp. OttesenSCG-928-J15]|nr:RsiV family protein [Tyzzerella sp. OttesenSCG-928-J15]